MWALSGQPNQDIRQNEVDAFNKLGKGTIKVTFFQNDPYKAKIPLPGRRTADPRTDV
jgi:hypothetical protein